MESYENLLKKAISEIPESASNKERFESPKIISIIQGNKTIIQNFTQICDQLSRKPLHLQKYLLRELAAPGEVFKSSLKIGSTIKKEKLEQKLESYINTFVLCNECNRPDTKLEKDEKGIIRKKCMACGTIVVVK
ncbi:translation initiation factor IF-2 subunit beta [Candidatus Woesearchaeota archaeon]|jgi:translation initiation factor 2 subunit 2|nr:translation initiation factor IF-2 subunit beta [Candidatus Woesearchaeota archaeon]MBT4387354.1 translation initiation factor IF-2 subunit beta [Candidatus Woesearchaeota archaeon]MBT4595493.1 translation initiation factor IF-2 subunit beta [Candidatus Woesearchaeota archaeon]MBT5740679.1 translation initiation factor IF-2 subunit beta [Candidatus Woesearchaeota archaeon]MBT6506087.1 translation initiation factor IF-2 subunit beta [Candidatus Woesearchaeota archaeon]